MKRKTTISLVLGLMSFFIAMPGQSEDIIKNVELKKVTLFLRGAELQSSTSINVPKGESEILLSGLARNINVNSINVSVGNQAMILSTTLVDNYIVKKTESEKLPALREKFQALQNEYDMLNIQLSVVKEEIALLQGNRIDTLTTSNKELSQARQAINFVKENLTEALKEKREIQQKSEVLKKQILEYKSEIALYEDVGNSAQQIIKVKVYADDETTLPVTLSYLTREAGWEPIYDVRVKDISSPLELTHKANIYQYSGLDWNHIDFTLSTSNPSEGISAPILTPWYIYLDAYHSSSYSKKSDFRTEAPISKLSGSIDSEKNRSLNDHVNISSNGINKQFNIDLPYGIKAFSKDNIVTLKVQNVDAEYRYVAAPKLDNNAFLQAQIVDWDKLLLIPGKSTIFYSGSYVGEGYITTQGVKDKLNISLGRDKDILIARNQDVNERSKPSFFGNEVTQKFAYTIDVRNTKDLPIDITIYDQLPISQYKAAKIEDAKYANAAYDKEKGLLTWQLNLKPRELKQLSFSFNVNYPKDSADDIIGL